MPENENLAGGGGDIIIRKVPREVDFFYITRSEINELEIKTIFTELFTFFASLMAGGFIPTLLTKLIHKNVPTDIMAVLSTLYWVFFIGLVVFSGLFVWLLIVRIKTKNKILKISKIRIE